MALNTQTIELDISKPVSSRKIIRVAQGDSGGCTLKALLYDNGAELSLTSAIVYLVVKQPDKQHYYRDKCSVSGNIATIALNETKLCSIPGFTDEAYFEVTKSSQTSSTERFCMDILPSALINKEPAEDWDNAINQIISSGSKAISNINLTNATIAEAEAARAAAEKDRVSAEAARVTAESARVEVESARASAESARQSQESARQSAETSRKNAETSRLNAEKARVTAENGRVTAENARVEAEKNRVTEYESVTTAAQNAATQAEGAATNATAAATAAELIVNNLKSVSIDESNASKLEHEVSVLGSAVSDLKDDYILIGERIFVPASRVASNSGEKLALNKAIAVSGEKITLT